MKKGALFIFCLFLFVLKANILPAQPNDGHLQTKIFNKDEQLNFCTYGVGATVITEKIDSLNTISVSCYSSDRDERYRKCTDLICSSWDGLWLTTSLVCDYKLVLTSVAGKEKMIIFFNDISYRAGAINIDFTPGIFRIDGAQIADGIYDYTPADWESVRIKRASRCYQRRLQRRLDKNKSDV